MIDPADSWNGSHYLKSGNKEVCRWFAPAVIFCPDDVQSLHESRDCTA